MRRRAAVRVLWVERIQNEVAVASPPFILSNTQKKRPTQLKLARNRRSPVLIRQLVRVLRCNLLLEGLL